MKASAAPNEARARTQEGARGRARGDAELRDAGDAMEAFVGEAGGAALGDGAWAGTAQGRRGSGVARGRDRPRRETAGSNCCVRRRGGGQGVGGAAAELDGELGPWRRCERTGGGGVLRGEQRGGHGGVGLGGAPAVGGSARRPGKWLRGPGPTAEKVKGRTGAPAGSRERRRHGRAAASRARAQEAAALQGAEPCPRPAAGGERGGRGGSRCGTRGETSWRRVQARGGAGCVSPGVCVRLGLGLVWWLVGPLARLATKNLFFYCFPEKRKEEELKQK